MGSEAKPKSSKRVELRAQTYEDLKQYSYTLRALRTQAIQDSPSYTLDILKAKRNSNDASRTTDHARYGDGGDPALGSLVPAPSTSTVDLPPRAEATPPFVEGGPEFMTLWPDRKALSYVPEWSFEEEIEALLRISYQTDGKRVHVPMLHDHPSEDADPELAPTEGSEECVELTSDLVTEVADHIQDTLTDIFSYLALHRPQEPPERALYQESMGWDQVLNALHGSGIVPQNVLDTVHKRMSSNLGSVAEVDAPPATSPQPKVSQEEDLLLTNHYSQPPDAVLHGALRRKTDAAHGIT